MTVERSIVAKVNEASQARRACFVVTPLDGGAVRFVAEGDIADDADAKLLAIARRDGKSRMIEDARGRRFIDAHIPAARLVIVGAVHIAQALSPIAAAAGYDVTIVDPRTAFATPARFPGVRLIADWPQDVLEDLALDAFTAFAALTHDPKIDDPGLHASLAARCFYVGALGSRKTHGKRLERLSAVGAEAADLARIHAPIGLDIGAVSPAEIAISIMAEIIQVQRRGSPE